MQVKSKQLSKYKWTNPSVLSFIKLTGNSDPIEAIEKYARNIAYTALDKGWSGPPFDPILLAETLKIPVSGNAGIADAKTVPVGRDKLRIEFNPNRPRGRVRFSIAHEIAHTFFPDCSDNIRFRDSSDKYRNDDWQLELLCNIAGAELIMPIGDFEDRVEENIDIDVLLDLRKEFDVSMEAILIRAAKLTNVPCNIFCASRDESDHGSSRYKIDYIIPSNTADQIISSGTYLSDDTLLSDCTAVGFTAKGVEHWPEQDKSVNIECVGLPPYPNKKYPRVAGIIRNTKKTTATVSQVHYITGDVLETRNKGNKIIAHVVNDKTPNWGGGRSFAATVKKVYPEVQQSFRSWKMMAGDHFSLGNTQYHMVDEDLMFAQMIAQKGYGPSPTPRIKYSALESCINNLSEKAKELHASIHMPRIGCGYGGGSWEIIDEIIAENLARKGIDVYVYSLPKNQRQSSKDNFLK